MTTVERFQVVCPNGAKSEFFLSPEYAQEYAEWGHACMTADEHTLLTVQVPLCDWFADCEGAAPRQVQHPTLGWVATCDEHVEWIGDATQGPKFVPPLVAANMPQEVANAEA